MGSRVKDKKILFLRLTTEEVGLGSLAATFRQKGSDAQGVSSAGEAGRAEPRG